MAVLDKPETGAHTRAQSHRTFKVTSPHMKGDDIKDWQKHLNFRFSEWSIDYRVKPDGYYGVATRDATASLLYAFGVSTTQIAKGVTPELRIKIRNRDFTAAEKRRFKSKARTNWRRRLREKHARGGVAPPIAKIISSSWGYHKGVHDGVDLICKPNATLYAMCKSRVIDVRSGGWWGNNPSGDVSKGDGIIQLEVLETVGPFETGMHIGYGHAEHATVREGQIVEAGDVIGKAGLAVAWHTHLMVNGGGTSKGVGDRDPMPLVRYALRHA